LGTLEPQDQIAAAIQWGALPYIDENRIGIWGASYGGYNTLLSMMKYDGPSTIKLGIAMSSGVDFQLYDTIYTEKYMSTPGNNEAGYKESNVVDFVDRLQEHQKLLIVHGDLDDNAHYQGAVALVAALQKANKQFRFMVYPGGNHSYFGTGNPFIYLHIFTMMTDFIVENL
jgi:dipeptidyl-peptidase-4